MSEHNLKPPQYTVPAYEPHSQSACRHLFFISGHIVTGLLVGLHGWADAILRLWRVQVGLVTQEDVDKALTVTKPTSQQYDEQYAAFSCQYGQVM
jgi:hypothetical protein